MRSSMVKRLGRINFYILLIGSLFLYSIQGALHELAHETQQTVCIDESFLPNQSSLDLIESQSDFHHDCWMARLLKFCPRVFQNEPSNSFGLLVISATVNDFFVASPFVSQLLNYWHASRGPPSLKFS